MTRSGRAYLALFVANLAAVVVFWALALERSELASLPGLLNAAGRLAAVVGTYLLLLQLVLRTHVPWLVTAFGKDLLKRLHTWNAYVAVALIAAHVVLQTLGYALQERLGLVDEIAVMLSQYEGMVLAVVGSLLLGALTILALDRFRHRLAWPTWRALHLYTYAAVALSLPHIIATGSDFIDAPGWAVYWVIVELGVAAVLIAARVPPIWRVAAAAGRPHPAIVAIGALIIASYLLGTIRLTPTQAIGAPSPSPRVTSPPSPATTSRPTPTGPLADASLVVEGDAIDTPYGMLQVRLILASGRVADVEPVMLPSATKRSHTISLSVEPWLRKRAVAAQSADFEILSGATYTSRAYQASLESALRAAGLD